MSALPVSTSAHKLLQDIYGSTEYPEIYEVELWKAVESIHGKRESKVPWSEAVHAFYAKGETAQQIALRYSTSPSRAEESIKFGLRKLRSPLMRFLYEKTFTMNVTYVRTTDEGDLD